MFFVLFLLSLSMAKDNQDQSNNIGELKRGELDSDELESVDPTKITRFYRVPSARFKTANEIICHYGYRLGDEVFILHFIIRKLN